MIKYKELIIQMLQEGHLMEEATLVVGDFEYHVKVKQSTKRVKNE